MGNCVGILLFKESMDFHRINYSCLLYLVTKGVIRNYEMYILVFGLSFDKLRECFNELFITYGNQWYGNTQKNIANLQK